MVGSQKAAGSCSELVPGLMFGNFLRIPDAESLLFYPLVLKLAVWGGDIRSQLMDVSPVIKYLLASKAWSNTALLENVIQLSQDVIFLH